jgi:hypothetical protein
MNLFGAPQMARSYSPAWMEGLDLPCASWSDICLLQVQNRHHLQDAPCPVSVKGKGKVEPVLN